MQRIAFLLQTKPGMTQEYEDEHHRVWPELIAELERFGITEYSIFRYGLQLFLYMRVENFDEVQRLLAESEVNQRWQRHMAPLFDPVPGTTPETPLALMREVFYMPGSLITPPQTNSSSTHRHERKNS